MLVMNDKKYRHEYKYPISIFQKKYEEQKIMSVAKLDNFVNEKGYYNIRSIYFDDIYDSCYMDNENGVDEREKFRIRIYDNSDKIIKLESKQKKRGKTLKVACAISKEQCSSLMHGKIPPEIYSNQNLLRRLSYLMSINLMRPKIIVDYDRIPYIYRVEDANVRVTFDMNISSSEDIEAFFDKNLANRGVLPNNTVLMEVKFDDFFPQEIYSLLQLETMASSTFSKYYLCRKYRRL